MTSAKRIPALDGLRGLAILLVLLFHFHKFAVAPWLDAFWEATPFRKTLSNLLLAGWCGVDLFFVLSGFLITGILLKTRESKGYFKTFFLRRSIRILPLYIVFLVLMAIIMPHLPPLCQAKGRYQPWVWTFLSNILVSKADWQALPLPMGHLWSLAIEEQFYLVWPLVILTFNRQMAARVCAGLIVVALMYRMYLVANWEGISAYVLTPARFDALAAGSLLSLTLDPNDNPSKIRRWAGFQAAVAVVGLTLIFVRRGGLGHEDPIVATLGYTLMTLGFTALVGLAYTGSSLRWMGWTLASPLRFLGKYSYALYIFHQPTCLILWLTGAMGWLLPWAPAHPGIAMVLCFAIPFLATTAFALTSWHVLERPLLKVKERWTPGPESMSH